MGRGGDTPSQDVEGVASPASSSPSANAAAGAKGSSRPKEATAVPMRTAQATTSTTNATTDPKSAENNERQEEEEDGGKESSVRAAVHDGTLDHAWVFETSGDDNSDDKDSSSSYSHNNVISASGLENIAKHAYVPGQATVLDNCLNPIWTFLTELLPLWLAPNAVTALGGLHCGIAYGVLWYYVPNLSGYDSIGIGGGGGGGVSEQDGEEEGMIPSWAFYLCSYCTLTYYTLDCMDGKQARRTQTSSPLGQLFDHGFDCICNLTHVAVFGGYAMLGGWWFVALQFVLQFGFFVAQWEEYYTHALPHSVGGWFGVTEVNYGLGLVALWQAYMGPEKRVAFWTRSVEEAMALILPNRAVKMLPIAVANLELRHATVVGWAFLVLLPLFVMSLIRLYRHLASNASTASASADNDRQSLTVRYVYLSALSKLISPLLVIWSTLVLLPTSSVIDNARAVSVASGLVLSHVTKKMIVYSMAKMTYASIQLDVVPFVLVCLAIRLCYGDGGGETASSSASASASASDASSPSSCSSLATVGLAMCCVLHAVRLVRWAGRAIEQICGRLGIYCLSITEKPPKTKKEKVS